MYTLNRVHHRTYNPIGKTVGVIFANSEEDAQEKAWKLSGGDFSCKLQVWEVPAEGDNFTVYYSEMK